MAVFFPGDHLHRGTNESGACRISQDKPEGGGSWYFSKEEIEENSPSRRNGIDMKKESYLRKSYCTFLQDLGMRLKVPQVTIATAIIFCHRFFLRQSHAKNDRRMIATVCMFLAGKVEETPRPLKDVIIVAYEIIHKKDPAAVHRIKQKEVYEQQKEVILLGERVVLATLGFDLNLLHPYKPLVEAIKKFEVAQNALAQVAWNFVNDGLRTSLCLQFKPHHIAAGAIFLAAKFLKVKLPSDGEKVWWQEFNVTPRQLEEVSNQMLELYEQNRIPPSQASEAEGSAGAGVSHRVHSKTPDGNEEHTIYKSNLQGGDTTSKHVFNKAFTDIYVGPSKSIQNRNSDYGSSEVKDIPDQKGDGQVVNQQNELDKDKLKIDKDRLKAAIQKRKKARDDINQKVDVMDEEDIIERELEEGIELVREREREKIKQERRQSWSNVKNQDETEDGHNEGVNGQNSSGSDLENVDGEMGRMEEAGYGNQSPKSSGRKRKAGVPPERDRERKQRTITKKFQKI